MLPDNNDYKDLVEANGEMIQLYWSGVSIKDFADSVCKIEEFETRK